jgi:hypothetical protein
VTAGGGGTRASSRRRPSLALPGEITVPDVNEVYLLPSRGSPRCIVCHPSAEALVDGLREGAFALCPAHLLRAHVHGNEEDGAPSLRKLASPPPPPPSRKIGKGI